ncbi:MAG: sensor histidine kinase, partial [Oleispira sp.]|nr:sensor histidine kinase [Oleispira sp.]
MSARKNRQININWQVLTKLKGKLAALEVSMWQRNRGIIPALLFLLIFISANLFASNRTVELDELDQMSLLSHSFMLEDARSVLDWRGALSQQGWQPVQQEGINLGVTQSSYWFRTSVSYRQPHTRIFKVSYPLLDWLDFYLVDDGELIRELHTGDYLPFNNRDVADQHFVLSHYSAHSRPLTLLIRVKTQGIMVLPFSTYNVDQYVSDKANNQTVYGIYYGICIAMFLYNLMLYIYLKDQSYLYYCMLVAITFFNSLSYTGHGFQWFWPDYSIVNHYAFPVSIGFNFLFATVFMQSFLQLNNRVSWGRKVYYLCIFLSIISIFISVLMEYSESIQLLAILQFILTLLFLFCTVYLWYFGVVEAKYFTIAWLSLFAGITINSIRSFGIIPTNDFTVYANLYGTTIEMLLLSMGLAYRFETMRKTQVGLSKKLRVAQQDAIKNLEKYRDLFQYCPVGLFRFERDSNQIETNKKIDFLMGYKNIKEFINSQLSFSDYKNLIRSGDIKDRLIKVGNDKFYSLSIFIAKDNEGRIIEIEGSLQDVSEQKKSEVIRIASEKEKLSTLTQLVFGISHQFNTPLGILVMTADLIENDLTSLLYDIRRGKLVKEDLLRTLTSIKNSQSLSANNTKIMSSIIKDLSYSISTRTGLNISEIKSQTFFNDVFRYFESQLPQNDKKFGLTIDIKDNGIEFLYSDYDVLADVFSRLFANTYYHAYANSSEDELILIRLNDDESYYYIEYYDYGRGLEETERENIFVPFFTGNSRQKNNSGLGMYILHNQIVKVLHGKIDLLSPQLGFGIR